MVLPPPSVHTDWFDDDGELTELDSEDEEDLPPPPPPRQPSPLPIISASTGKSKATRQSTQTATEKSRVRRGLKNTVPFLKPPRTTNYSASSLFDWIQDDLVDLNPDYQRGVVWPEFKQMALIDSLFRNFFVAPILFLVKRNDDGSEIRVCIDGKQRLTSIHRFMLGEIAYKDPTSNRKSYYACPPGSKKKFIADHMRSIFRNKQIACCEYDDITEEQEREMFQRVQLGVSLTPADRLAALNSPYADLVRGLRSRMERIEGFEAYLNWGSVRGKDFLALAQIIYLIEYGTKSNKAEPTTSRLEAFLGNQVDCYPRQIKDSAENVLDIYCRVVSRSSPLHGKLTSLEFVMAAFLIDVNRKKLSDTQLSDAITRMHDEFAKASADKKVNQKNFKFLHSFILKDVPKLIAKVYSGQRNETPAFDTRNNRVEHINAKTMKDSDSATKIGTIGKRKREDSECTDEIHIKKKRVTTKQKLEVQPTPPLDTVDSKGQPTKTKAISKTPSGRLPVPRSAQSAKTVVKRLPGKSGKTTPVSAPIEKKISENQVVKPTVRPPASARITLGSTTKKSSGTSQSQNAATGSASVSASASTSASASMKSAAANAHTSTSISAPLLPETRPPLPGRPRVTTFASVPSSTPLSGTLNRPPPLPYSTPPASAPAASTSTLAPVGGGGNGGSIVAPQISHVQITAMPQQAEVRRITTTHRQTGSANTNSTSSSFLPPFSGHQKSGNLGGRGAPDRLAALWNAKATVVANPTGGGDGVCGGSGSGVTRGGVDNPASMGSGSQSSLPKFHKYQAPTTGSETRWNTNVDPNAVQGGEGLMAAAAAREKTFEEWMQTPVSVDAPFCLPQLQPKVMSSWPRGVTDQVAPTRDPRKVFMEQMNASKTTATQTTQRR